MLIDRAPEPELFSNAFHDDLVQIPNIAGSGLPPPQVSCDLGAGFGDPTTDCLIGNVDPTLKRHFLNFTQAQIEPQVKPNCVSNDLRRKTVTLETDIWCLHRRYLRPTRTPANRKPVNVTTPGPISRHMMPVHGLGITRVCRDFRSRPRIGSGCWSGGLSWSP